MDDGMNEYEQFGPRSAIPDDLQEKLREYLNQNPMVYLDKIQEWLLEEHNIVTCVSTIDQTLCKMEISLKKKSSDHFEALRPEDGSVSRSRSCGNDACRVHGFCRSLVWPRGRAPDGQWSDHQTNYSNAKQYSVLPGILLYGVLGMDIKEKSFKRPDFESFLKHTLVRADVLTKCSQYMDS
ncbi:hypothetical protein PSTG_04054 [Puccinia striiformis f. sp. tritici PST-78]|uniref:Uncharacterized protein n=1 Tax=Puccinia striiformis f. sp. tritici PST-78 TaxID=1165861 RepID=A0A0L0VU04_9BASI|nr:hypothetical protein PSTG_04054 [Puccinia striiformis f. sp. tritici PST-78]